MYTLSLWLIKYAGSRTHVIETVWRVQLLSSPVAPLRVESLTIYLFGTVSGVCLRDRVEVNYSFHLEIVTEAFHSLPPWKHLYNYFSFGFYIHELDVFNFVLLRASARRPTQDRSRDRIIQVRTNVSPANRGEIGPEGPCTSEM